MKNTTGFTLVEMMIVVALLAVLASIAIPAYREQAERGRRADGKAFLLDVASRQERFYTQYSSYTTVVVGAGGCAGSACGLNFSLNSSPKGFYSAGIAVNPNSCAPETATPCVTFVITVTPSVADTKCTTLTLDSAGVEGKTGAGSVADCWR